MHVICNCWRGIIGPPKTEASEDAVPVIRQLEKALDDYRRECGNPADGPIFMNGAGHPHNLDALAWRQIRPRIQAGWHGFRRGLATNLKHMGIEDKVIQAILRHSNVAVTQKSYIKTMGDEVKSAMQKFEAGVSEIEFRSPFVLQNVENQENEVPKRLQ